MNGRKATYAILGTAIALAATVAIVFLQPDPEPQGLTQVNVAQYGHVFIYLPLYIANANGYYEDEGLQVQFISTGGDEKTFAAVASGDADFGVADPSFAAIAEAQGLQGRVIATLVNRVSFWGVSMNPNLDTTAVFDGFNGLTVATYPAPSTNYTLVLDAMTDEGRLESPRGTIREAAYGSLLALLENGDADIAMELEPTTTIAIEKGAKLVYSFPEHTGPFAFTGITASPQTLLEKTEMTRSFLRAVDRAIQYMYSDIDGAVEAASQAFPELQSTTIRSAMKRLLDEEVIPMSIATDSIAWNAAIDLRVSVGDLTSRPQTNLIDNRFIP